MSLDTRLDRLLPAVSGRERAILVLKDYKEGKAQDHRLAQGMPPAEIREYNRLIRLLTACNTELVSLILLLRQCSDKLALRLVWLMNVTMWECLAEDVDEYLSECTKEPVTESEYREIERQGREEFVPASALAYKLTSLKEDWAEEDLEDASMCIVRPEAWEPVEEGHRRELARLVAEGVLVGRGKGKGLKVNRESFYGWLGKEVEIAPEWGAGYGVFPDADAALVRRRREQRAQVRKMLAHVLESAEDDEAPA